MTDIEYTHVTNDEHRLPARIIGRLVGPAHPVLIAYLSDGMEWVLLLTEDLKSAHYDTEPFIIEESRHG